MTAPLIFLRRQTRSPDSTPPTFWRMSSANT